MKETLEEAAEKCFKYIDHRNTFIAGVKWQQEQNNRLYSEEQLRNALLGINLVNPAHLKMTSDGYGEFPDSYKLTENGIRYIIEQFENK